MNPIGRRLSMTASTRRASIWPRLCVTITCIVATFSIGLIAGTLLVDRCPYIWDVEKAKTKPLLSGSVNRLSETPFRSTTHKDDNGKSITKQQFIEPFYIPNVAGYSVATITPGQRVAPHEHESMHEFFYVIDGHGVFVIEGIENEAEPGTFFHIAPHERHEIFVPSDSAEGAMKVLVSGVVVKDEEL